MRDCEASEDRTAYVSSNDNNNMYSWCNIIFHTYKSKVDNAVVDSSRLTPSESPGHIIGSYIFISYLVFSWHDPYAVEPLLARPLEADLPKHYTLQSPSLSRTQYITLGTP